MSWRTTLLFQPTSFAVSICRLAERDAVRAHLVRLLDDARGVQQRFRRNAADVQAHAAERRPALDERDLEPEIGGAKRRRVAAGPGADHGEPLAGRRRVARPRARRRARRGSAPAGRAARSAPRRGGARAAAALLGARRLRPRRRSAASSVSTRSPAATLSPFLIATDTTVPALRRGHVHRRLVGLERDERILGGDSVAGLYVHLDDVDGGKVPELGDPHFDAAHGIASTSCPGFARISPSRVVKRTAFAPSMTR